MNWHEKKREEKFMELYKKYGDDMYRYAFSILKNEADAQDAVQNALIRLYDHLETVMKVGEKDGKESAYVMAITRNAARDLYKKNRNMMGLYVNLAEEIMLGRFGCSPSYFLEEREKEIAIQACLKEINED